MEIIVAKYGGFCTGVRRAVDTAKAYANRGASVLGELIHNPVVLSELESLGVHTVDKVEDAKGKYLIIRSHGAPLEDYEKARAAGLEIVDCTCEYVRRIHRIVREYSEKGYRIIIAGEPDHPEVVGINSRCGGRATIVRDETVPIRLEEGERACVVAQTTFPNEKFAKIFKNIAVKGGKTVEIFPTICYTTRSRQEEAAVLAAECDAMIVIGGRNSSNTKKLADICREHCKEVFWIADSKELDVREIKNFKKVGIVSGASTPNEQLQEVFSNMAEELNTEATNDEMEKALNEIPIDQPRIRKGDKIVATISSATDDGLALSINAKTEILLPKEELTTEPYDKAAYESRVGEKIEVVAIDINPVRVSEKALLQLREEEALIQELRDGKIFTVVCDGVNKGGLTAKYGTFQVFVPASQIRFSYVQDLEKYKGKTLRLRAMKVEIDRNRKQIVGSQKAVLIEEREERERRRAESEAEFFATTNVGDVVDGEVVRFAEFGAFVSVKGFDCLAHISDLSWSGVKEPGEVLEIGKTYQFKVLRMDPENHKVSIGYRQLQPKPWETVTERYQIGDVIHGKVVRIVSFGAFVEVEKGIDGLVHVSQISHDWLENPTSALHIGEEIDAKILDLDPAREKMTLSIKALLPEPEVRRTNPNRSKREDREDGDGSRRGKGPRGDRHVPAEDDGMREWKDEGIGGASIGEMLNNK